MLNNRNYESTANDTTTEQDSADNFELWKRHESWIRTSENTKRKVVAFDIIMAIPLALMVIQYNVLPMIALIVALTLCGFSSYILDEENKKIRQHMKMQGELEGAEAKERNLNGNVTRIRFKNMTAHRVL